MDVEPFTKWLENLKSTRAKQKIFKAINKIECGLLSDCKPVGSGVQEYRIHIEKGYRIYFGNDGGELVILLCGSTKADQDKQIRNAIEYWNDYKRQKRKKQTRTSQKAKR